MAAHQYRPAILALSVYATDVDFWLTIIGCNGSLIMRVLA